MRNTGQVINVGGNLYALCEQNGQLYIYDPRQEIPSPLRGAGLGGLGLDQGTNAAWAAANVGLNFIPVVGNILSAVSSVAQALFGGGDPTPIEQVWKAVIDTREQLALAINTIYGAGSDPFAVDPSLNRESDGDAPSGTALAAEIAANIMKLPSPDRHKVKRQNEYDAIKAMQGELTQLNDTLKTQSIEQQIIHALSPAPAVAAPLSLPAGVSPTGAVSPAIAAQVAPQPSLLPWLLPVGALILYGLAAN